jgi:hypothetical protein
MKILTGSCHRSARSKKSIPASSSVIARHQILRTKTRSDAILNRLPPEQRSQVEGWLFEENQAFNRVAQRCHDELGVAINASSVKRYYHREKPRWVLEQRAEAVRKNEAAARLSPNQGETHYRTLLSRMIQVALDTALSAQDPAEQRVVCDFAKVLISARRESHEALRAATMREKFEFDAATSCLIHQVKTQAIAADASLDDGQRIQKIREELFGLDLPESSADVAKTGPDHPPGEAHRVA